MFLLYIIISVVLAALILFARNEREMRLCGWLFYVAQGLFALYVTLWKIDVTALEFFTFDKTGLMFFVLLSIVSPVINYCSIKYLDVESLREKGLYNALTVLLCISMTCVYFANNVVVTWIFLEATTLCTAGLIYHRRTPRSLEGTWKYVFVCSVGIAIAYLGILLMGGVAVHGDLSYANLASNVAAGNPLFMKIAFLFILVGYSSKMEIFPLYNIGVDANIAAPAPASALISSGLVNAGFISIYRMYKVMERSNVFEWASSVLIIVGIISIIIGAVFMRRANHYKRFLSYSTVENMGIAAIGLGVGGIGVFAALFHVAGHTILKSMMFLQISEVGKTYGHYQIKRTGDYMKINPNGASLLLVTTLILLAFPPSPLFVSEVMILKQVIMNQQWFLLVAIVMLLCLVIYNFGRRIIRLCYQPTRREVKRRRTDYLLIASMFSLLVVAMVFGVWQPEWLVEWMYAMAL